MTDNKIAAGAGFKLLVVIDRSGDIFKLGFMGKKAAGKSPPVLQGRFGMLPTQICGRRHAVPPKNLGSAGRRYRI